MTDGERLEEFVETTVVLSLDNRGWGYGVSVSEWGPTRPGCPQSATSPSRSTCGWLTAPRYPVIEYQRLSVAASSPFLMRRISPTHEVKGISSTALSLSRESLTSTNDP